MMKKNILFLLLFCLPAITVVTSDYYDSSESFDDPWGTEQDQKTIADEEAKDQLNEFLNSSDGSSSSDDPSLVNEDGQPDPTSSSSEEDGASKTGTGSSGATGTGTLVTFETSVSDLRDIAVEKFGLGSTATATEKAQAIQDYVIADTAGGNKTSAKSLMELVEAIGNSNGGQGLENIKADVYNSINSAIGEMANGVQNFVEGFGQEWKAMQEAVKATSLGAVIRNFIIDIFNDLLNIFTGQGKNWFADDASYTEFKEIISASLTYQELIASAQSAATSASNAAKSLVIG